MPVHAVALLVLLLACCGISVHEVSSAPTAPLSYKSDDFFPECLFSFTQFSWSSPPDRIALLPSSRVCTSFFPHTAIFRVRTSLPLVSSTEITSAPDATTVKPTPTPTENYCQSTVECLHLIHLEKQGFHQAKTRAEYANISFPKVLYFDRQHKSSDGAAVCVTDYSPPSSSMPLKVFVSLMRSSGEVRDLVAAVIHMLRALVAAGVQHRDIHR